MKYNNTLDSYTSTFKADLERIKEKATNSSIAYINSLNLSSLSNKKQVERLHSIIQSLEEEYNKAEYKKYILFSKVNHEISHIDFTNNIITKNSEINIIEKAILFTDKYNLLIEVLNTKKLHIKKFLLSSTSFKFCTPNTPTEHFYKKREIHLISILKIVAENLFQMQFSIISLGNIKENISTEKNYCLNKNYSNLFAYKNTELNFRIFKEDINEQEILDISINNIEQYQDIIQAIALNLYISWVNEPINVCKYPNFNKIFNQQYNKQISLSQKIIEKQRNNILNYNKQQLENKINSLEKISKKLSCLIISDICNNKHHIKSIFFSSLLRNNNLYLSLNTLKYTIIISNIYYFYIKEYTKRYPQFLTFPQSLNHLVSMGTNNNIFNTLIDSINKNRELTNINETPIFSLYQDTLNSINNAFRLSAFELEEQFDTLDSNKAALLHAKIQKHLNVFKNRALRNNVDINPLTLQLENILNTEIEYLNSCSIIEKNTSKPNKNNKRYNQKIQTNSFGFKKSDSDILLQIIKILHHKITVFKDNKSVENFVQILTSKNIYMEKDEVYISCQTNEFAYILNKLKPYFHNLEFTKIERTKLFISRNNTPLKASNLYVANTDSLQRINQINIIFKPFNL